MKLIQLKNWIETLPEDVLEYNVAYGTLEQTDDEDFIEVEGYFSLVSIDDDNKNILILKNKV